MRADVVVDLVRGPRVLDVGCTGHVVHDGDPGWLHGRLRERFDEVTGIDISEENIERLRRLGFDDLHVQSAETFDLDGRCFDTIVAGELIEHLANPGAFLDRAKAHLAPQGRIVLTTPYPFSIAYSLYAVVKYPRTCQNPEHVSWFCPQTLTELGARYGLVPETLDLLPDYDPNDPSRPYRLMARTLMATKRVIPKRFGCNTMVVVFVNGA